MTGGRCCRHREETGGSKASRNPCRAAGPLVRGRAVLSLESLYFCEQLLGVLWSRFRRTGHQPEDEGFDLEGKLHAPSARRRRRPFKNSGEHLGGRTAVVRRLSGEHSIEDGADAVDIRPRIGVGGAFDLFRRHVGGRTDDGTGSGQLLVFLDARDAKVDEAHMGGAVLTEEDIGWLEVPVNHSASVHGDQRLTELADDLQCLRQRDSFFAGESFLKVFTVQEFADQTGASIGRLHRVEDPYDMA